MIIQAEMRPNWVEPYKSMGGMIPVVTWSDHPKFKRGTRFDWGLVQVAMSEGCTVQLSPANPEP